MTSVALYLTYTLRASTAPVSSHLLFLDHALRHFLVLRPVSLIHIYMPDNPTIVSFLQTLSVVVFLKVILQG